MDTNEVENVPLSIEKKSTQSIADSIWRTVYMSI